MSTKTTTVLRVKAKSGTFRRAGIQFGAEPQDLPLEALSEAARAAIVNEPMLVSETVDVPVPEVVADKPAPAAGAKTKSAKK